MVCVTIHSAVYSLYILIGDFVLDSEGTVSNLVEGSLDALNGLSLFTLVFISNFPERPNGGCGFCLSCYVFLGGGRHMFFSLSWTVFGGRIGDLFCWRKFCTFRRSNSHWNCRSYVYFCLDNIIGFHFIFNLLSQYLVKFG